jgi:hypothetical protein
MVQTLRELKNRKALKDKKDERIISGKRYGKETMDVPAGKKR